MFRAALVAFLVSAVSANLFVPEGDIPADSSLGMRLLSQATVVHPARHLADQNQADTTFIADYSLRYLGCSSLIQVSGAQNGNNNNKNNQGNFLTTAHLAKFALCPTSSCSSCAGGGEYVMNMETFIDSWTEAKLTAEEYACEITRENCDCENADDNDACENACYTAASQDYCIDYDGEENFNVQEYLECKEMEGANKNANDDGTAYYVGPYCNPKDGFSIHLGVYTDAYCTTLGDSSVYADKNYGAELPFATSSMVSSACVDCKKADNNNGNGYAEVSEVCEELYLASAHCETNMETGTKDTSGCDFINNLLPKLDKASKSTGSSSSDSSSGKGAKAFAGIFAFTTCLFAAYAYFLYRKIKRGSVDLSSQV